MWNIAMATLLQVCVHARGFSWPIAFHLSLSFSHIKVAAWQKSKRSVSRLPSWMSLLLLLSGKHFLGFVYDQWPIKADAFGHDDHVANIVEDDSCCYYYYWNWTLAS